MDHTLHRLCRGFAPGPGRRGVALLLVLGAVVIAAAAFSALAALAVSSDLRRDVDARTQAGDELAIAAQEIITRWLGAESSGVVLPPDAAEPGVVIVRDAWSIDGEPWSLTIEAWDRCGMLPAHVYVADARLARALPPAVAGAVRDGFVTATAGPHIPFYPRADGTQRAAPHALRMRFGDAPTQHEPDAQRRRPTTGLLGWLPTHGSSRSGTRAAELADRPALTLNICTAPAPLLSALLDGSGAAPLREVLRARAGGTRPPTAAAAELSSCVRDGIRARLITRSSAWSFRVDAAVGPTVRSYWLEYEFRGSSWEMVARGVIDE